MTGIIDYNAGNIKSVQRALESLKAPYILSKNPEDLKNVDRVLFPGVGDAAYAMEQLKQTGFDSFIKDWVAQGKPLTGICLGSQIVFDYSEEGDVECLGLIKGSIRHFSSIIKDISVESEVQQKNLDSLKIPHIGFNNVTYDNGSCALMEGIKDNSDFYFVHSYVIQPKDNSVIKGYAEYGIKVPSIIQQDNITVFQFHPEKSGSAGLSILRNYVKDDLC